MAYELSSSFEVEMAVLGCAMTDAMCAHKAAQIPQDAFAAEQSQAVHRAIKRLIRANRQVDMVTVSDEVRCDIINSEEFLMRSTNIGFLTSSFGTYYAQLMGYRQRRIITDAAEKAIKDLCKPSCDIDQVKDALDKSIRNDYNSGDLISASKAAQSLYDWIDRKDDKHDRCYTGIGKFDRITGGLRGGKLVILGARPGIGKTALALYMARHVCSNGGKVMFVSLEMDERQLMARIAASIGGYSCQVFETQTTQSMDDKVLMQIVQSLGKASALKLSIATRANTPLQVRTLASQLKYGQGLSMIVIDYLQLMRTDTKGKSRYEQVSEISRELKLLAQDLGIPIVAMTQFNRQSQRDGSAPTMAQAKDSGSIEQDANIFLILHAVRKKPDIVQDERGALLYEMCAKNDAEYQQLIVAKNRQGSAGVIDLKFDKGMMRFTEIQVEQ